MKLFYLFIFTAIFSFITGERSRELSYSLGYYMRTGEWWSTNEIRFEILSRGKCEKLILQGDDVYLSGAIYKDGECFIPLRK